MPIQSLRRTTILAGLSVALLAIAACSGGDSDETEGESMVAVERGTLSRSVSSAGNTSLANRAELRFEVAGEVVSVLVEEGDVVVEGQALASLDVSPLEVALLQAQANAAAAQNVLDALNEPPSTVEMELATVVLHEAGVGVAHAEASLQFMDIARAKSVLAKAQEALDALEDGPDLAKVLRAMADLASAQLALVKAERNFSSATIRAPFAGVVITVNIEMGDQMGANAVAITVADPNVIEVTGLVDEVDIAQVRVGMAAQVSLTAMPQLQARGQVDRISLVPAGQQGGVVSYPVTIALQLGGGRGGALTIRDGMTVTTSIIVNQREDVLLVPTGAVRREDGGMVVTVVVDDVTRETRSVSVGLSDSVRVEITEGLAEGEQVLVSGGATTFQTNFFRGGGAGGATRLRP
jgi:HlyD family secretion protein